MKSVRVEIFGQEYCIKGQDDEESIRKLAQFLDAKMKDIQKGTGTADPLRVAILTALTITDELHRTQQKHRSLEQTLEQSTNALLRLTESESGD